MAKTLTCSTFLRAASWRGVALALLGAITAAPALAQSGNPHRDRVMAHQVERAAQLGVPLGDIHTEVVGGKPAKDGRWPFMVALVDAGTSDNYNAQFCGASLIGPRDVLTAAHCVSGAQPQQIQVLVGTQDLNEGGRRVDVTRITSHPKYNSRTSDSDIAVLRLSEAVNDIEPVEYITSLDGESKFAPTGRTSFGMGWGNTEVPPFFPSELHNVKVPIVDREVCNSADSYGGRITDTMLCAGLAEGGKDTCQGDSGGPLVVKNASKAFHLQVGVVSWGWGCADPNFYGIYSRMATLGAWVKDQVKKP
ncbi:MAG: serine protease [Pseudomonadota bacterium]